MHADESGRFRLSKRQRQLIPILMLGSFFEGFDFMIINLSLPFISRDLGVNIQATGLALSVVAVGALMAFFVIRLSDRLGRKPIFLGSVAMYASLSIATAFTPNIQLFVLFQFLARVFLVSVWGTGFIIVAEEFQVEIRGRALSLFQSASAIGAIFPAVLMPILAHTSLGWRGLYLIGGLPLLFIFFVGKYFHETERFTNAKAATEVKPSFFAVFQPPYRRYLITLGAIWFFIYLCYTSAMTFFSYRVVTDLNWTESRVGTTTAIAYLLGLSGYWVAGKLLDSLGRKRTAVIFFLGATVGTIATFQSTNYTAVLIFYIIGTFFVGVLTVIGASFTNELFPTAIRANATAWVNNIFGRLAQILAPTLVGFLALPLGGISNSVSLMALGPLAAIILVLLILPETRHQELQDLVVQTEPPASAKL